MKCPRCGAKCAADHKGRCYCDACRFSFDAASGRKRRRFQLADFLLIVGTLILMGMAVFCAIRSSKDVAVPPPVTLSETEKDPRVSGSFSIP